MLPNRRSFLMAATAAAPALALAGCVSQAEANTIAVTLGSAQAQANAILAALKDLWPSLAAKIPAEIVTAANNDLTMLENDVGQFALLTPGASFTADAQAVVKDAGILLPLLPLPPATSFAISMGIGLINALLAGIASIPAPPAATPAPGVAAPAVVPGPIPIPLS